MYNVACAIKRSVISEETVLYKDIDVDKARAAIAMARTCMAKTSMVKRDKVVVLCFCSSSQDEPPKCNPTIKALCDSINKEAN